MANQDIKHAAVTANVKLWQIAELMGMADTTFSRKLRHELSEETKQKVYKAISQLSNGIEKGA